jgi:siroheme synthase (precorrin-2 oxidase/ferrochelatase)
MTIAVSTGGAAPSLAGELRDFLGEIIGPGWDYRLRQVAVWRRRWREANADHATIRRLTRQHIARYGWFKHRHALPANDGAGRGTEKGGGS